MRHNHDFDVTVASVAAPLFNLTLLDASHSETADALVNRAELGIPTVVNFVNTHCAVTAGGQAQFASTVWHSDARPSDGAGLRLGTPLAATPFADNLNGSDLFPIICERAAARGTPIFLLGGSPGIAAAAAEAMQARFPGLIVAGTQHGFFSDSANDDVVDQINASGAAILFVGFGAPRQEQWIARHREALDVPVLLGVGRVFDYYSGRIPGAPLLLSRLS